MFTLTINTANDAFAVQPEFEVAAILKKLADRLEDGCASTEEGRLLDVNGNTVGSYTFTEDNEESHNGWSTAETYAYEQTWSNIGENFYTKVVDAATNAVETNLEISDEELGEVAIRAFYAELDRQHPTDALAAKMHIGDRTKINAAEVGEAVREYVTTTLRGA